ncbi:MAG: hypothetical protein U0800_03765 [Isosphaeraceae bacterium]
MIVRMSIFGQMVGLVLCLSYPAPAQTIWVEAEKPLRSNATRHPGWYDQVKKDMLSGGDWISNWSTDTDGTLEYRVEIPKAGRYAFWIRANAAATKLDYALDAADWTPVRLDDLVDTVNVAADGKIDLRFLSWIKVGDLDLKAGPTMVRFRMRSENHHHGALDAFTFTTEPFTPVGAGRPGTKPASPELPRGTWAFQPSRDTFSPDALFDLRSLNEKVAGEHGFVKLSKDGEGFALGDGSPVRFWAVTTYVQRDRSSEELAHHARFLAKRGVNMVRYHGEIEPKGKEGNAEEADPKALDQAWKLVAAMKKEGIYTTISPYWASGTKAVPASWKIDGWPENQPPVGLLFFDEALQRHYKSWLKALLSPPNPYTGVPLAKEPAVALFQIQNEDSLLFWTEQAIKGPARDRLARKFGGWLKAKYGSLESARKAWGGARMPEDSFTEGKVGLHIIWQMTQNHSGGMQARIADQLCFYGETMANFNREIARYLREDLGCSMLVNAGNWRSADTIRLDDVERWSYTANEVLAVNRYYSPVHLGPDQGWRIGAGDRYQDESVLFHPRDLPVSLRQAIGHPICITESHWVPPLGYQAEAPFLVASYSSLTGVDTFYWFCTGEAEWSNQDRAPWDSASRAKWSVATPMIQGQFPATALMYRQGYIQQGEPVVVEHRSLEDLWSRRPPLIAEDPGYDPNRDLGDSPRRSNLKQGIDPLAFLVGPVKVAFDGKKDLTRVADVSRFIDGRNRVVTSNTGQLRFDYGRGVCDLNAPMAQGAAGFLAKAGTLKLRDVTIRSANDYGSVLIVPLDGKPIASSDTLLVQVGTKARPAGWAEHDQEFEGNGGKTKYQGKQIDDTGKMPWAVDANRTTLTIGNPGLKSGTKLDINGNPAGEVPIQAQAGAMTFSIPPDALYVVLRSR